MLRLTLPIPALLLLLQMGGHDGPLVAPLMAALQPGPRRSESLALLLLRLSACLIQQAPLALLTLGQLSLLCQLEASPRRKQQLSRLLRHLARALTLIYLLLIPLSAWADGNRSRAACRTQQWMLRSALLRLQQARQRSAETPSPSGSRGAAAGASPPLSAVAQPLAGKRAALAAGFAPTEAVLLRRLAQRCQPLREQQQRRTALLTLACLALAVLIEPCSRLALPPCPRRRQAR